MKPYLPQPKVTFDFAISQPILLIVGSRIDRVLAGLIGLQHQNCTKKIKEVFVFIQNEKTPFISILKLKDFTARRYFYASHYCPSSISRPSYKALSGIEVFLQSPLFFLLLSQIILPSISINPYQGFLREY